MKLIYIAGAYTAPTRCGIAANVQRAREVADAVARLGAFPVTPHFFDSGIEDAGDAAFWYAGTLEVMRRCDALIVAPGSDESKGTSVEIAVMVTLGKPVFLGLSGLKEWIEGHP